LKIEEAMRLTPTDASRLAQESKVRRDQREAAGRAEAERRSIVIRMNEERVSKELARLEEGLKNQTRNILVSALQGHKYLVVRGEIFDFDGLQTRGFSILYRRPLRVEESIKRETAIQELESELESLAEDVDSAIDAWSHGICCQSERISDWVAEDIRQGIEAATNIYTDMKMGLVDYFERSDGHSIEADECPESLVEFIDPDVVRLIPADVEWRSLNPEVPRLMRMIDRLVAREPEINQKILSYKKQIADGILVDRPVGGPDQIFEITWECSKTSELWDNFVLDEANAAHWISGGYGQELFDFIDESVKEVVDEGKYSLLNLRLRQPNWHSASLSDEFGYQSFSSPPSHILAELLRLLDWTVEVETPDEPETYLFVSW
jgi:hypothetical protein